MSEAREYKQIGKRPIRHDGFDKVTGRASYGADLSLPGMLWAKVLRSPHAHAAINSIDTSKAEALDGVMAVATSEDLPAISSEMMAAGEGAADVRDVARNCLAQGKALYHGHAVAAVAAISQTIVDEALQLIEVDYTELPPVMDGQFAMGENVAVLHDDLFTQGLEEQPAEPSNVAVKFVLQKGDVEKGFAEADEIVEREYYTPTVHQGYIEPHACTVRYDEQGQSMIWCSTQGHFDVRATTAKIMKMELTKIKVIASEVGGAFGAKTTVYQEPVALVLSKKSGRPVKMVMTREEVFIGSGPGSGTRNTVKIGAKKDGTITAMRAHLIYEAGAFKGSPMSPGAMCMFAPYDVDNMYVEGYDVVVNKPKVAAYRAPGAPQSAFAAESAVNEIAEKLGLDPIEIRLKNAAKEGTQAIYGAKFNAVGLVEALQAAKGSAHYKSKLAENQGRGVACGFWFNAGMQSSVVINMNPDGSATVVEGSPDLSGTRISLAMMAAEELGIPVGKVSAIVADTDGIGVNSGSGGSRTTFATGMTVIEAAQAAVKVMKERAASVWNVTVEQVDWVDGVAINTAGEGKLTAAEICATAPRTGGPISGSASMNARGAGPGFVVHVCDVDVDRETGRVQIARYTAVQDAGKAIHPSYVEGQFQGGAIQGAGWALNEEYVYSDSGRMENPGFLDYRIPLASDLPMIETIIVEVPNPYHPYGVRGVGESGIIPPLATVASAVSDAIGIRISKLPCSPPNVLKAIKEGSS
ncbi:MAG: xanthine dehydrogenase family protein molybdopterin-binding subunit [Pseudomonadales bacterium]|jgi:CO/xanthine dehydrogenase Mo-binding subunit|nr:xanthine dehydrogenase family protein molybdopterin-binding subunit [Pseudomonadales bacterium]MDP7594972.1 xanthine dehydrogenase family protein molybdopterin-binding subunit [Pseudomonadales bacterium]HJN51238.1 xanthine dehydrogenase family protein molybdopterin-binding subunit [Pseudomonadales bacterium]|tara:strand:+ start:4327 stop:6582 length:2256 start_codon:yes stop_codon:yes gene_type:complete